MLAFINFIKDLILTKNDNSLNVKENITNIQNKTTNIPKSYIFTSRFEDLDNEAGGNNPITTQNTTSNQNNAQTTSQNSIQTTSQNNIQVNTQNRPQVDSTIESNISNNPRTISETFTNFCKDLQSIFRSDKGNKPISFISPKSSDDSTAAPTDEAEIHVKTFINVPRTLETFIPVAAAIEETADTLEKTFESKLTAEQIQYIVIHSQFRKYCYQKKILLHNIRNQFQGSALLSDFPKDVNLTSSFVEFHKLLLTGFSNHLEAQREFNFELVSLLEKYQNLGLLDEESLEGTLLGYNIGEDDPLKDFRTINAIGEDDPLGDFRKITKSSDDRTAASTDDLAKGFTGVPKTYQPVASRDRGIPGSKLTVQQILHYVVNKEFERYCFEEELFLQQMRTSVDFIVGELQTTETYLVFYKHLLKGFQNNKLKQRFLNTMLAEQLREYRKKGLLDEESLKGPFFGYDLGENDPLNVFRPTITTEPIETSDEHTVLSTKSSEPIKSSDGSTTAPTESSGPIEPSDESTAAPTDEAETLVSLKQIEKSMIDSFFKSYYREEKLFLEQLKRSGSSSVGELDIEEVSKDFYESYLPEYFSELESQIAYNYDLADQLREHRKKGLLDEESLKGATLGYNIGENDPLDEFRMTITGELIKSSNEGTAEFTDDELLEDITPLRETKLEKSSDELFISENQPLENQPSENQLYKDIDISQAFIFSGDKSKKFIMTYPEEYKFNLTEGGDELLENKDYYEDSVINIDELVSAQKETIVSAQQYETPPEVISDRIYFNPGFVPKLRAKKSELAFDLYKIYLEKYNLHRTHEYINSLSDFEVGEYVFKKGILQVNTSPDFIFNDNEFLYNRLNQYYNMEPNELPIFTQLALIEYDHRFGGKKQPKEPSEVFEEPSEVFEGPSRVSRAGAPSDIFTSLPGGEEYPDVMSMSNEEYLAFSQHMDEIYEAQEAELLFAEEQQALLYALEEEEEEEYEYGEPEVVPSFNFIPSEELKRSNIVYTRELEPELVEALGNCFKSVLLAQLDLYQPESFKKLLRDFEDKYGYNIRTRMKEIFPIQINSLGLDTLSSLSFNCDDVALEKFIEENYNLLSLICLDKSELSKFSMPMNPNSVSYDHIIEMSKFYRLAINYQSFLIRKTYYTNRDAGAEISTAVSSNPRREVWYKEVEFDDNSDDDDSINIENELFLKIDELLYHSIHWKPSTLIKNINKKYKEYDTEEFDRKFYNFIEDSLIYLVNPKNDIVTNVTKYCYDKFISYFGYDAQVRLNTKINNYFGQVVFKRSTYSHYFSKSTYSHYFSKRFYLEFIANLLDGKISFSSTINSFKNKLKNKLSQLTSPLDPLRHFMGFFTHSEYVEQIRLKNYNDLWNKRFEDARCGVFDPALIPHIELKPEENRSEDEKKYLKLKFLYRAERRFVNQELVDATVNRRIKEREKKERESTVPTIYCGEDERERLFVLGDKKYHYILEEGEIEKVINVPIICNENNTIIGYEERLFVHRPENFEILVGDKDLSIIRKEILELLILASKKDLINLYEIPEAIEVIMNNILFRREYEIFHLNPIDYTPPIFFIDTSLPRTLAKLNAKLEKLPFERTLLYGEGEKFYVIEDDYNSDSDKDLDKDSDKNYDISLPEPELDSSPEYLSEPELDPLFEPELDSNLYPTLPYYFIGGNYNSLTREILEDSINIYELYLTYMLHTSNRYEFHNILRVFEVDEESIFSFTNESVLNITSDSAFRYAISNSKFNILNYKINFAPYFENKHAHQLKHLYKNNLDLNYCDYSNILPRVELSTYINIIFPQRPTTQQLLIKAVTAAASRAKNPPREEDPLENILEDYSSKLEKIQLKSKIYKDLIESNTISKTQIKKLKNFFRLSQLEDNFSSDINFDSDSDNSLYSDSDSDGNDSDDDDNNNSSNIFDYVPKETFDHEQEETFDYKQEETFDPFDYVPKETFDHEQEETFDYEQEETFDYGQKKTFNEHFASLIEEDQDFIEYGYDYLNRIKYVCKDDHKDRNIVEKLLPLLDESLYQPMPPIWTSEVTTSPETIGEFLEKVKESYEDSEETLNSLLQLVIKYKLPPEVFEKILTRYILLKNEQWWVYERDQERISKTDFTELLTFYDNFYDLIFKLDNIKGAFELLYTEIDFILDQFYDLVEYRFSIMPLNKGDSTGLTELYNIYCSAKAQLDGYLSRTSEIAAIEMFKYLKEQKFRAEKLGQKIEIPEVFLEGNEERRALAERNVLFHSTYFSDANYIFRRRSTTFNLITPHLKYNLENSLSRLWAWDRNITPGFFKDAAYNFYVQLNSLDNKGNKYPISQHQANKLFWEYKFGEKLPYNDINLYQFIKFIFDNMDIFFASFIRKNQEICYSHRQFLCIKSIIMENLMQPKDDYENFLDCRAMGRIYRYDIHDHHSILSEQFKNSIRSAISMLERPISGYYRMYDNEFLRMGVREELKNFLKSYTSFEVYKLYLDSNIENVSFRYFMKDNKYQNMVKDYEKLYKNKEKFTGTNKLKVVKATDTFSDEMLISFLGFSFGNGLLVEPIVTRFPTYIDPHSDKSNIDPSLTILDCLFNYKEINHDYKIKHPIKSQIASAINLEEPHYPKKRNDLLFDFKRNSRSKHIEWVSAYVQLQSNPFFSLSHPASLPLIPKHERPRYIGRFLIPSFQTEPKHEVELSHLFALKNSLLNRLHLDELSVTYLMHLNKLIDSMFLNFKNEKKEKINLSRMRTPFVNQYFQLENPRILPKLDAHNRRLYDKFLVVFNKNFSIIENAKNYDEIKEPLSSIGELFLDMDYCRILPLLPHEQYDIRDKIQYCITKFFEFEHNSLEEEFSFISALIGDEKFREVYASIIEKNMMSHSSFKEFNQIYLEIGALSGMLKQLNEMGFFKEKILSLPELSKFAKDLDSFNFAREYLIDDLFNEFPKKILDEIRLEFIKEVEYYKPFSLAPNTALTNINKKSTVNTSIENEKKTTEIITINESNNVFELKNIRDEYIIINTLIKLKIGLETIQNKINSFITFISLNEAHNFSEFIYIIYEFYYLLPKFLITNSINYLKSTSFKEIFQDIRVYLIPNNYNKSDISDISNIPNNYNRSSGILDISDQNPYLTFAYYVLRLKYDDIRYNHNISDILDISDQNPYLTFVYYVLRLKYDEIRYNHNISDILDISDQNLYLTFVYYLLRLKYDDIRYNYNMSDILDISDQNPYLTFAYYVLRLKYDDIRYNHNISDILDISDQNLYLTFVYYLLRLKYDEIYYNLKHNSNNILVDSNSNNILNSNSNNILNSNYNRPSGILDISDQNPYLTFAYYVLRLKYDEIYYNLKHFDIYKDFLDKDLLSLTLRYFHIVLKNELQDDIVSSTIRAIKTVEQPLLADVVSTYIPSRNWIVRNFMVRRTNSEIEFIFPIGHVIQNNIFDPINRFIESRMNSIGNYLVNAIENNSTCIRLADRYLTDDNIYNFYNSCNNYYAHMLGIYQEFREFYNYFSFIFFAHWKREYLGTLDKLRTYRDYYNYFYSKLIRPITRDISEFHNYQYYDNLKPAFLDILKKLTPLLAETTADLQLYFFLYNVFIHQTTKVLTGDFSSFFTIIKLFKEIPQEFLRDLIAGFKSTQLQQGSTFEDQSPSINLLYRPIGRSQITTDVFHGASNEPEIVFDEPEIISNESEIVSNEPEIIFNEPEIIFNEPETTSNLNDKVEVTRSTASKLSIPYKSIESFKTLSFQDKNLIESFLYKSRRLDKFIYFNFNALDIEKLIPKVFEDPRTEEEKIVEPYRPLTTTSDKQVRDTILKSINLSRYLFKKLICSKTEKLFTMEFVDLAHYVSELAIDCILRDKIDKELYPNLNDQQTNINEIDALIYKILKYQNLEPQVKPEILKFLYQEHGYNFFGELAKVTIKLSTDDFFKSYLFRVEDKFPFIGSPLNYFTADIKLRIDQGLTYAFRLIGVKNNFAQISIFNGKSFISLIHDMTKSNHANFITKFIIDKKKISPLFWDKKLLPKFRCEFHNYDNDSAVFSSDLSNLKGQFLVSMDEKVFVLEEHLNKFPYQGQIRMIFGDNNPVQKFTQLSSYQQFLNPALRSLLQFDFGFTKIDYNDFLRGNFLTQKSILNINYKLNIDKSFSTTPKFQIIFNNPVFAGPYRSFVFPDFLEKTDYYLKSIGEYINDSTHRFVSHNAKMMELFSNKNILKLSQLYADRNFHYGQAILKSQWNTNKYIEKFFKLSASWVKAYRDHEFNTKLNKNIYNQLRSYNVVDHVYSAPTSKRLEPIKFRSQYRYMMNSQNSWPSLYGGYYYPKFLQKNLESRFFKVFEYAENTRNSSIKHLDHFFFKQDFQYLKFTFDFFEDYCIHFTDNIPVKFLHKSLYSNYKPLNTNIAAKELNLFYRNFKQCVSNIIENPTEAAGFVMYPLTPNYSVPVIKITNKIKNSWTNISQKSLPFYKDFNGFLQGFDVSSYVINLISTFDIILNDKDRRFWEGLPKVTPIMFYRFFRKQAGIPLIHPDMQAPYFSFTGIVKNPTIFKFDTVLIPNQIRKPYYHRRYTNIFSQYLWSRANKYSLKPMIIANPHEQIEFSRGNFINLPNSFKQINLLQTKHQTNAYFSIYKAVNLQNKLDELVNSVLNSIKNTIDSMYNLNNPKFQLQNIIKLFCSESKYWNSNIILWHIQNNKLFCNMFASNYRVRLRLRITYTTAEIPITNSSPSPILMEHAGTQTRFDYDIYEYLFLRYNFGSIKRLNEIFSSQEHEKNDSFKWFYYFKDMKRLNKLDLIKSEGYKFDIPNYEFIKDCIRYQKKELLEYHTMIDPQFRTKAKKKVRELYRPDPLIPTLPNKTILKSFDREGLDFKLFLKFNSSIPPVLRENKHITSLVSNYIKNLDQTQPLAIPNMEQKDSKLIKINKKEFNIKKSVLLDNYNLITDLLENENFSWILYHEYREELIKTQTNSFPAGLMLNFCSSIIQGSILTFVLLAADFRRAPTKLTASFLLSWKTLFVFSFFSLLAYTIIDVTGFDVLIELLKKTEFPSGFQKIPQNVIKPFQLNATLDDFDATTFRMPFTSKKQATWHFKLRPILDCSNYYAATEEDYFLDYSKTKAPAHKAIKK